MAQEPTYVDMKVGGAQTGKRKVKGLMSWERPRESLGVTGLLSEHKARGTAFQGREVVGCGQ